ncbi:MAG: aldolase/citrate lyase family protein [Acidobacteria bacterium]|nr:aldolase/citrate lyase family protein [Acidobacteriota bacterium]
MALSPRLYYTQDPPAGAALKFHAVVAPAVWTPVSLVWDLQPCFAERNIRLFRLTPPPHPTTVKALTPMAATNWIKRDVAQGGVVFGAGITINSPLVAEFLAAAGANFLFLDLEHGALNLETAHLIAAVVQRSRTLVYARVASQEAWQLKQALDLGVHGVVVPFVTSAAEAGAVVRACKYPPQGIRGFSCQFAAARWGLSPGVDMVFVGPADLSVTCGFPMNPAHPDVAGRIAAVARAAQAAGVALGTVARTPDEVRCRAEQGFTFMVIASDTGLLLQAGAERFAAVRNAVAAEAKS